MSTEPAAAGDIISPECQLIEVRVAELRQLFNAIDPSPFRERDLDPRAEAFIVDWCRDLPADAPLALLVYLERGAGMPEEAAVLGDAIHQFFRQEATSRRRNLRELFRRGRASLVIGLAFVGFAIVTGNAVVRLFEASNVAEVLRESLLIGSWVAMWRPLEIFLYDWWPIRAEVRLFDRLSAMPVRIVYTGQAPAEAWQYDWPAVAPNEPSLARRAAPADPRSAPRSR